MANSQPLARSQADPFVDCVKSEKSESKTSTNTAPTVIVPRKPCCPYHWPIVELVASSTDRTRGYIGLDRFLKEGSNQQPAAFLRPDNGLFSLAKDCTCGQKFEQSTSKL